MVDSPPLMMLEGGKRGKKKQDDVIRSPPSLNSSFFDNDYFPTDKRKTHEDVDNSTSSLLCNNNSDNLKQSACKDQRHKTIAFSDLIPKHTQFAARTKSPRKIGLTPRLHRRRNDGPQCNNLGVYSKNSSPVQNLARIDPFSSTMFEPTASPRPHTSSSSLLSSSIDVFSNQKAGHETEEHGCTTFDDFALTPTCLYDDEGEEEGESDHHSRRPQSVPVKLYHRSPHWSGRVNINPFSPVPEQYLNSPSAMSPTRPFNSSQGVLLPTDNTSHDSPKQKKAKRTCLTSTVVDPSLLNSGANVTTRKTIGDTMSAVKKRKVDDYDQATFDDENTQQKSGGNSTKRKCVPNQRSRYLEDFQEIQLLGSGSFGTVCACLSRLDGCMYAVKSISPDGVTPRSTASLYGRRNSSKTNPTPHRDAVPSSARRHKAQSRISPKEDELSPQMVLRGSRHWSEKTLNRMLREVFALAALCNQSDLRTFHIVRYHQAWMEDDGNLYIQTELCKSTVRDELNSGKRMETSRQFKILREVLLALQLVHEQGCVHLDIKPGNIFIKDDMFKLGDFGLATLRDEINAKTGKAMDVEEGDSRYMPRDMLDSTPEDLTKCDIFSLGITLYETCTDSPLPLCGQEWQNLRDGKFPKPVDIDPTLYVILKQMMHPMPSKRPSASDLLSRSELSSEGVNVLQSKKITSSKGARPLPLKRERSLSWT